MATHQSARSISLEVALATEIAQHRFVRVDNNGNAVQISSATTQNPVGVALEASTSSQSAAISVALLDGAILPVEIGGSVTAGQTLTLDANGRAVSVSSGSGRVVGTALEGGSSGDVIRVASGSVGRLS